MAAASGRTTGIATKWYYTSTAGEIASSDTWTDWVGTGKLVEDSNQIKYATGAPEFGADASSGTESVFGEARQHEFPLPSPPANFELDTQYDGADPIHSAIATARATLDVAIAAHDVVGEGETVYIVIGKLKETKIRFDSEGLKKMTIPVAVDDLKIINKP